MNFGEAGIERSYTRIFPSKFKGLDEEVWERVLRSHDLDWTRDLFTGSADILNGGNLLFPRIATFLNDVVN